MYNNILIPYDGSDEAQKAAVHGIELAAALGSSIHALYVIDLPGAPRALSIRDDEEEMRERYQEYGEEVTGELANIAAEHGVECTTAIKTGTPSERIVEYAKDEGMDAIVIGSAYRGKIGALLGSTTDKVVRTATVPVVSQRMEMDEI
jgi:nucleotide-binding universal stress UspA family protein